MEKTLVLKDLELQILLMALGVKGMFGFESNENMDERQIPYLVHEMARKELIEEKEGRLLVKEPCRSMVVGLKDVRAVLLLKSSGEKGGAEYLCFGTRIIRLWDSINDNNAVKLQVLTEEQCVELLNYHFVVENQVNCPNELMIDELWDESAHCKKIVELYIVDGVWEEGTLCSWNLYEGRYRNFIKVIDTESISYRVYEEWDSAEIMKKINYEIGE